MTTARAGGPHSSGPRPAPRLDPQKHVDLIARICKDRGIRVRETRPGVFEFKGPGVDLLTRDLQQVKPGDLVPPAAETWRGTTRRQRGYDD